MHFVKNLIAMSAISTEQNNFRKIDSSNMKSMFRIVLLMSVFAQSIPFYFGIATSFATGTAIALIFTITLWLKIAKDISHKPVGKVSVGIAITSTTLLVSTHTLVALYFKEIVFEKALASLILVSLLLFGSYILAKFIQAVDDLDFHSAVTLTSRIFLVAALLSLLGFRPFISSIYQKAVFPFTEPSHLAIVFAPFLVYKSVSSKGHIRFAWLFAGFFFGLFLENMTLLVCTVAATLACVKNIRMLIGLFVGVLLVSINIDQEYFLERLDISDESNNISALVLIQGWQLIGESLENSNYWGLGFQQLGINGTNVDAAKLIYAILGKDLNLLDGSFLLSKLVSEFGIVGLIIATLYIALAIRSLLHLRKLSEDNNLNQNQKIIFCHAVIFGFVPTMFLRAMGYFSGINMMLIAALFYLSTNDPEEHTKSIHEADMINTNGLPKKELP